MFHFLVAVWSAIVFIGGMFLGSWLMRKDMQESINILRQSLNEKSETVKRLNVSIHEAEHRKFLAESKVQAILDIFRSVAEPVNCGWSKAGRIIPGYEACSREHGHEGPCAHDLSEKV